MVAPLPLCSPPFHDWKLYVFGLSSGHPYAHSPSNRVATNVGTCRTKPASRRCQPPRDVSLLAPAHVALPTHCMYTPPKTEQKDAHPLYGPEQATSAAAYIQNITRK
mmetsp:Transcript_40214/g.107849  ORF Transcript_40214/g.107849 Transcript_40214/m.107849 type:complete len:107 (+) Transcript_40214:63-383(+)